MIKLISVLRAKRKELKKDFEIFLNKIKNKENIFQCAVWEYDYFTPYINGYEVEYDEYSNYWGLSDGYAKIWVDNKLELSAGYVSTQSTGKYFIPISSIDGIEVESMMESNPEKHNIHNNSNYAKDWLFENYNMVKHNVIKSSLKKDINQILKKIVNKDSFSIDIFTKTTKISNPKNIKIKESSCDNVYEMYGKHKLLFTFYSKTKIV